MSTPFYVSPEQVMKDRADYARKGIARGRSLVALECAPASSSSPTTRRARCRRSARSTTASRSRRSGSYSEYQLLRMAGVRHADLKGYSYSREDVSAKELANRVLADAAPDLHARDEAVRGRAARRRGRPRRTTTTPRCTTCSTTASSSTSSSYSVLGGSPKQITEALKAQYTDGLDLGGGVQLGAKVLGTDEESLGAEQLEVALLDRHRPAPRVPPHQERRARRHARERVARRLRTRAARVAPRDPPRP